MPNPDTQALVDEAARLGIGFHLGYAELVERDGRVRHFNTSVLVDRTGKVVGKYPKVHPPGHREHEPRWPFQHLGKRYFETGDLGFPVAAADLDRCREIQDNVLDFAKHREPQNYGLISRPKDAVEGGDDARAIPKRGGKAG